MLKKVFRHFGKDYMDENYRLVLNNRFLMLCVFVFILFFIVQWWIIFKLLFREQLSVVFPPYKVSVTYNDANQDYYKMMGEWMVEKIANVDKDNVADKINTSVRYFDKNSAIKMTEFFRGYIHTIKSNAMTQSFSFKDSDTKVELDGGGDMGNRATIIIHGTATQQIGDIVQQTRHCVYEVRVAFKTQTPYFTKIYTDCFRGNSVVTQSDDKETEQKIKESINNSDNVQEKIVQDPDIKTSEVQNPPHTQISPSAKTKEPLSQEKPEGYVIE